MEAKLEGPSQRPALRRLQVLAAVRADRFGAARLLFYVGLLTMTWLHVRVATFTLSDWIFLASLGLAGVAMLRAPREPLPRLPLLLVAGLVCFVAGSLIATAASSDDPTRSLAIVARVSYLVVAWLPLAVVVLRTPDQIRRAVGVWVAGAAVCGAWAIGQKAGVLPDTIEATGTSAGRVTGLADHFNDLGALAAVALAPAFALLAASTGRDRIWTLVAAGGVVAGLVLSGSVGAALAASCALIVCLASRELARLTLVFVGVGAIATLVAAATVGLGSTPLGRLPSTIDPDATSGRNTLHTRLENFRLAWERVEDDPLVGAGLDERSSLLYSEETGTRHAVHNLFLGRWFESGLLGLVGIVLVVVALLTTARDALRATRAGPERTLIVSLCAALLAFLVVAMSEPLLYKRYALVPAALLLAAAALRRGARD